MRVDVDLSLKACAPADCQQRESSLFFFVSEFSDIVAYILIYNQESRRRRQSIPVRRVRKNCINVGIGRLIDAGAVGEMRFCASPIVDGWVQVEARSTRRAAGSLRGQAPRCGMGWLSAAAGGLASASGERTVGRTDRSYGRKGG